MTPRYAILSFWHQEHRMLHDLDETIRQILIKAGEFDPAEVDISFDIPTRDWSGGIQKPTLNCYLFDIHERRMLREEGWQLNDHGSSRASRRQPPLFYEITYLITAWTQHVEDEHQLLWDVLQTLVRFPVLNDENAYLDALVRGDTGSRRLIVECLAPGLAEYPWPISTTVAQLEGVLKSPGEFWTALENQLKPSLSYVVTLAHDRQAVRAGKPVLSTGIGIQLPDSTAELGFRVNRIFSLPPGTPLHGIPVAIKEATERENTLFSTNTDPQGMFKPEGLPPGRYIAEARVDDRSYRRIVILRDPDAQRSKTVLRDVIRDQDGQPLPGVVVEVEGTDLRATTNADGAFTFNLRPGRYTLRLQMPGWSQRRQVTIRDAGYTSALNYGGVLPDKPSQDSRSSDDSHR